MKIRNFDLSLGVLAIVVAAAGCKKEEAPAPAAEAKPAAAAEAPKKEEAKADEGSAGGGAAADAEADKIFKGRCVNCHGETGQGDGAGAAALKVKPRNYTDAEWQKSVTDDDLAKIIVKGGASVGKDAAMPPNPDLRKKKDVVAALVKKVRSFAKAE